MTSFSSSKYLIFPFLILLQGCASDLFPGGRSQAPQETINELITMDASLGPLVTLDGVLPDDIGANLNDEWAGFVNAGSLAITIVPNDFVEQNIDSGTFLYAFSQRVGEDFELLVNPRFSTPSEPLERVFFELYSSIPDPDEELLKDISDFYLDSNIFIVPSNATHLELRYETTGDSDPSLVRRWELADFYGYNRYIKPLINASQ